MSLRHPVQHLHLPLSFFSPSFSLPAYDLERESGDKDSLSLCLTGRAKEKKTKEKERERERRSEVL